MKRMTRLVGSVAVLLALCSCASAPAPVPTPADDDPLRTAIEKNWNIPVGLDNIEKCTVSLRLHLAADGAVSKIERLDDAGDAGCDAIAESARRAILITQNDLGRLPIPKDSYKPTIVVTWPMKEICEQHGGC